MNDLREHFPLTNQRLFGKSRKLKTKTEKKIKLIEKKNY